MNQQWVYNCIDSTDGILTGIHHAYHDKHGADNVRLDIVNNEGGNISLCTEYIDVVPNIEKAISVADAIMTKISPLAHAAVMKATLSHSRDKADAIYRYLLQGFKVGARIVDEYAHPVVEHVWKLNRHTDNEFQLYLGFLRFEETIDGIMIARFKPANDIAVRLMPHFADRFPDTKMVILDTDRHRASLYAPGAGIMAADLTARQIEELMTFSTSESEIKGWWKAFFTTIAIAERTNKKVQMSHAPLHYRTYMHELDR